MADPTSHPDTLILVVDDEAVLRLLATDVLEDGGFRVLEAADALTALRILADHRDIGVVFTDVNMPGPLDGIDLAREVHRRWPAVKLVVTSGRMPPAPGELPAADCFVAKPYTPETLLDHIKTAATARR